MDDVVKEKAHRKNVEQRKKRYLGVGNHQLLTLKEVLTAIITEGQSLPLEVKQALEAARAATWKAFLAEHEEH